MKCKKLITFIFLPAALFSVAQVKTTGYLDFGSNQAEPSVYFRSGINGSYQWNKTTAEAGFLMNLKSENDLFFSGYRLVVTQEFAIKQIPFSAQAFYTQTFDEMLRETNWGLAAGKQWKHVDLMLGTYFKTYAYRNSAIETYGIEEENESISESFNLLYRATFSLKPAEHPWNASLTVTNTDYFTFSQETNPLFNLGGYYKINPVITVFAESWIELSGIFNINASYFGYYIRSGIILNISEL